MIKREKKGVKRGELKTSPTKRRKREIRIRDPSMTSQDELDEHEMIHEVPQGLDFNQP